LFFFVPKPSLTLQTHNGQVNKAPDINCAVTAHSLKAEREQTLLSNLQNKDGTPSWVGKVVIEEKERAKILAWQSMVSPWESGRDPVFSSSYGGLCLFSNEKSLLLSDG